MTRAEKPILDVVNLVTSFPIKGGILKRKVGEVQAVSKVSFKIYQGETLGLVGESGCGKSTVARTIVGLEKSESGHIYFNGLDLTKLSNRRMRKVRKDIQFIFQDPFASLHPKMTVKELIQEPWEVHPEVVDRSDWDKEVMRLMEMVGLNPASRYNYAHQFSGGQCQRICIARALALRPKLIICDEAVSALDVSIQAQILNLLQDLQKELGLAYLFISHDLSVVRHICDRICVMYLGKIVEFGDRDQIFHSPSHPYTQALLSAVPVPEPWNIVERKEFILEGDIPSPANPPSGCRFRTRCWKAQEICKLEDPPLNEQEEGHASACHFAEADKGVIPKFKETVK
ncbi:ABC transporter ATP-binding protein [Novibacillus thermophilus]|uniref:Peptide ABC transporter ATP-binding protein n=1 Tax=Novibacillus thermophilus TaxID=1471761 RepID=A0A1U9K8V8_9BACL|nr:oligopeptide/dipeptide ABC transporter ATP-binding protein [Novibacillus thermophilus]AQS56446.1 peptide ABC transporter ATP-binding protein [Novibacillus thermophilus]